MVFSIPVASLTIKPSQHLDIGTRIGQTNPGPPKALTSLDLCFQSARPARGVLPAADRITCVMEEDRGFE